MIAEASETVEERPAIVVDYERRLLAAARWYAHKGFAVLPLHTINEDGACTCGNQACSSPAKHPIASFAPHGLNGAVADIGVVTQWWAGWPDANVGIAAGAVSGIVVLDVDVAKDGLTSLEAMVRRYGPLPATWRCRTGGGGEHWWFRHPGGKVANSRSGIAPGIDVRGDGGYVVAPPSQHASGNGYGWLPEGHPASCELAWPPDWLVARLATTGARTRTPILTETVREGARNDTLMRFGCAMRRHGADESTILGALVNENRIRCVPPLERTEIEKIAWSVARYAPAPR
jgi:hypothetical protein